jgi:hypothetical protein
MVRSRKGAIVSGVLGGVMAAWKVAQFIFDAASSPENANKLWGALMSAPQFIPWIAFAVCMVVLAWSVWPPKKQPATDIELERARLLELERARLDAVNQARRERAMRHTLGGTLGDHFANAMEELEADRRAEAEARRQRMIRDAKTFSPQEEARRLAGLRRARMLTEVSRPAPPPPANRAFIGTPGAALFGLDEAESFAAIDIKNFGTTPATNVRWKAVAGWLSQQPMDPVAYEKEGGLGITEPGHCQNIKLLLTAPITSDHIRRVVRGGEGFYVLARIDYTDVSGARWCRRMAYYLDPQGERFPDKWMLSVCPTGNDELSEEAASSEPYDAWMRERISPARALVDRYNADNEGEDFATFLKRQPAFIEIRSSLSAEYFHRRPEGSDDNDEATIFLEELDRMEDELRLWNDRRSHRPL